MKGAKQGQQKAKRNAEDWVDVAREFGEKCQAVQRDSKLSMDQKLEKQKVLGEKMAKEIKDDPDLKPEEKKLMVLSITNYLEEWTKMHELIKKTAAESQKKPSAEPQKKQSKK